MQHMTDPYWLGALALAMALTGIASGTLAGLLGVGGGIVIVPVLFNVFPLLDIPEVIQMKLAVGTSLATIIPTSIQSARKHHARGAMDVPLFKAMIPSIAAGVAVGTFTAILVRGATLTAVFAAVALLVALHMGFTRVDARLRDSFPRGTLRQALGIFIGAISAMMGIGGGTVGVPLMNLFGTPIRSAVATASAFGIIVSIPATIGFAYAGWGEALLPPASIGYVNLIGFALIVPASMLATPWGVRLAHTIPPLALKRVFALFLFVTAARMIYSLLT